ncbi:MnmC family methyltransferase [Lyngbya aestuarii]|uniref:MnmC family methyltransferase n=1 Tax=Lyngbya aestuarii TaxID=118322 RepID=UPI00403D88A2
MPDTDVFTPQLTADGSFTFFSEEMGESFHSRQGAKAEALLKFVAPCQLAQRGQQPTLRILDVCYGLGYNSAAALEVIWQTNPNCCVELVALELEQAVPQAAIAHGLLDSWSQPIPQLLKVLGTSLEVKTERLHARLYLGDARIRIQQLQQSQWQADAIFLDPFSPPRSPQLWTMEFIHRLASCCAREGIVATYSCAAAVRIAFLATGLKMGETPKVGGRQPGTVGSFSAVDLPPLSVRALEHLQTRAAVPYRDPDLGDSAPIILQRRCLEREASCLEPTSHWKKRWLNSS